MIMDSRMITLGASDPELPTRLRAELWRIGNLAQMSVALNFPQLRAQIGRSPAQVAVVEDSLLDLSHMDQQITELTSAASIILVAHIQNLARIANFMMNCSELECVVRTGGFMPLLAAFIERRSRVVETEAKASDQMFANVPSNFPELFRHEINNPLTGILGNTEMVLAQRDRLPASAVLRLETVVDLAVRLREATRRLSQTWEAKSQVAHSTR
jgi:His Kinase A (phospho-acceptor) domain